MGIFTSYAPLDDISDQLALPSLIFVILTPIFVITRCISNKTRTGNLWLDDYLLLVACLIAVPGTVLMIVGSAWGFGKHEQDLLTYPAGSIPFDSGEVLIEKTLKLFFIDQIIYGVVMGLFKCAVLVWYTRIFETPNKKKFRMLCWTLVYAIAAFTVCSTIFTTFQCDPIKVAWTDARAHCLNLNVYWDARAYFNLITYFLVTFLPIPSVFGLPPWIDGVQMTTRRKVWICGLFGVGIFVCAAAILRVQSIGLAALQKDRMWNAVGLCMWSIIEDNVGIICVCLPSMAGLANICWKKVAEVSPMGTRRTSSTAGWLLFSDLVEKNLVSEHRSRTASSALPEVQEFNMEDEILQSSNHSTQPFPARPEMQGCHMEDGVHEGKKLGMI